MPRTTRSANPKVVALVGRSGTDGAKDMGTNFHAHPQQTEMAMECFTVPTVICPVQFRKTSWMGHISIQARGDPKLRLPLPFTRHEADRQRGPKQPALGIPLGRSVMVWIRWLRSSKFSLST